MKELVFKRFIVRKPGKSMVEGINDWAELEHLGKPEYSKALAQWEEYVKKIKSLGIDVIELPALEEYPDSCFVEDPVVVIPNELAIMTNPGDKTRNGEKLEMEKEIKKLFSSDKIKYIKSPGFMDGGDVLPIGDTYYIGLSKRTNQAAIDQFAEFVKPLGKKVIAIPVTEFLHLKTGTTYIENNNLLVTGEFELTKEFQKFNLIRIPKEENYAVNVIYINGTLFMPAGYPKTKEMLSKLKGYKQIVESDTSEYKKIDGGFTCLSVRF
ncbi:dimethylarginine dimethylaminohydrolase family protein [Mycoplasma sp. Mirounga ES2805-ORL]|uniref:dimethylarginine dimethylaminohydrolase family protein n=1 Tax=Mycoplasma sp. Mirounga ES2805-ORL TaxID=754514 RepID=UPI00197B3F9E|nr:arginine deiminase family protein [Mycoplasma sp. Mirounga ES2805-ORL]QSF13386.1 N(G),N(G)-dimethylarginine dimethylaminohydrolase [Mycoplasma sp. Mirounga ES2805-ORL]